MNELHSEQKEGPSGKTGAEDTTNQGDTTSTKVIILPQSTAKIMQTIFGDDVDNAVIGSYAKSPVQYWPVKRFADMGASDLPKANDNYTCVGTYSANGQGKANRLSSNCLGVYLVVLDDIGSKYEPPTGWGEPSYRMQTSINEDGVVNEQWGYLLDTPIKDVVFAKEFLRAMVKHSGSSDNVGDLTRFIRLPGSNNKPKYAGQNQMVRLTQWSPMSRYSVETMLGWISKTREEIVALGRGHSDIVVSDASDHPIVKAFWDADLLLTDEQNDEGWLDVTCPWEERHTTNTGTHTGLLVRTDGSWHVHCFHSSCKPEGEDKFKNEEVLSRLSSLGANIGEQTEVDCANWAAVRDFDGAVIDAGGPAEVGIIPDQRYIFLTGENMYWDKVKKMAIKKEALDTLWGHIYTGTRTRPKLSRVLERSANRVNVDGIGFHTINSDVFGFEGLMYANMYRPPSLVPKAGSVDLWLQLMTHIYGQYADLVIDHMAYTVQKPENKITWQVLVFGKPRTGKTLSVEPIRHIFGSACKTVNVVIDEKYDDAYVGSKVVIFEEIWGDRRNYNHLKSKLANSNIETLNPKSKSKIAQMNRYAMYMFSNHEDALSIDRDGDKLLVIEGPDVAMAASFYTQYATEIETGDLANRVYAFLLARDVSAFSHGRLPVRTAAAMAMVDAAAPEAEAAIQDAIESSEEPFEGHEFEGIMLKPDCKSFTTIAITRDQVREFLGKKRLWSNATSVKSILAEQGFELVRGVKKDYGSTPSLYVQDRYMISALRPTDLFEWMTKFYVLTDRKLTKSMKDYLKDSKVNWSKESLMAEIIDEEALLLS